MVLTELYWTSGRSSAALIKGSYSYPLARKGNNSQWRKRGRIRAWVVQLIRRLTYELIFITLDKPFDENRINNDVIVTSFRYSRNNCPLGPISNSIEPTNNILGTNIHQHKVHLMIKIKMTLTYAEGQMGLNIDVRSRSHVKVKGHINRCVCVLWMLLVFLRLWPIFLVHFFLSFLTPPWNHRRLYYVFRLFFSLCVCERESVYVFLSVCLSVWEEKANQTFTLMLHCLC